MTVEFKIPLLIELSALLIKSYCLRNLMLNDYKVFDIAVLSTARNSKEVVLNDELPGVNYRQLTLLLG